MIVKLTPASEDKRVWKVSVPQDAHTATPVDYMTVQEEQRSFLGDTGGYYDALLGFLGHSVREGFMSDWQMGLIRSGDEPSALLEALREEARRHPGGDKLAEVL